MTYISIASMDFRYYISTCHVTLESLRRERFNVKSHRCMNKSRQL